MNRLLAFGHVPPLCARMKPALRLVPLVAVIGGLTIGTTSDVPITAAVATPTAHAPETSGVAITEAPVARAEIIEASLGLPEAAAEETPVEVDRHTEEYKHRTLRRWRVVRPGIVQSKSGATARVAQRHTAKFQCLVDWLDEQGFRIQSMGGIAARGYSGSLHPIGAALDIDQSSRNRLLRGKRYPAGTNEAASRCGLMHGDRTVWRNYPDYGHFQVAGVTRGRHRRNFAQPVFAQGDVQATSVARASIRHRMRPARSATYAASTSQGGAQDVR